MKSTATLFKFLLQTAWIAAVAFAAAFAAALLVRVITTLDPREAPACAGERPCTSLDRYFPSVASKTTSGRMLRRSRRGVR